MFLRWVNKLVCNGASSRRVYTACRGALAAYTHQAGRAENQDGFFLKQKGDKLSLAVADGMGGHPGGKEAAALALRAVRRSLNGGTNLFSTVLLANLVVVAAAQRFPQLASMGSTLTAARIGPDKIDLCHIGDSRAYAIAPGGAIELLTRDHSTSFELYEAHFSLLSPPYADPEGLYEYVRQNQQRNPLYSYLGRANAEIFEKQYPFPPGWRFLLVSDGLNFIPYSDLKRILGQADPPKTTVQNLFAAAYDEMAPLIAAGKTGDNITIILFENRA